MPRIIYYALVAALCVAVVLPVLNTTRQLMNNVQQSVDRAFQTHGI